MIDDAEQEQLDGLRREVRLIKRGTTRKTKKAEEEEMVRRAIVLAAAQGESIDLQSLRRGAAARSHAFTPSSNKRQSMTDYTVAEANLGADAAAAITTSAAMHSPAHHVPKASAEDELPLMFGKSCNIWPPTSRFRVAVYSAMYHPITMNVLLLVIMLNLLLMTMTKPDGFGDDPRLANSTAVLIDGWLNPKFVLYSEIAIATVFSIEMIGKVIALGLIGHAGAYLALGHWDRLDFFTTVTAVSGLIFPEMSNLSSFRALRVLRALRALRFLDGIRTVLQSVVRSLPFMVNVMGFLLFIFVVFGLLALTNFKGLLHNRCVVDLIADEPNSSNFTTQVSQWSHLGEPCRLKPPTAGLRERTALTAFLFAVWSLPAKPLLPTDRCGCRAQHSVAAQRHGTVDAHVGY